ncbi:hypothetical protein [Sphingopyxis solisilvae]|uniref:hypothetical protein n=1 Tax=Sphingopyxis solisilvae TaxID=1886788 RepID=UPI001892A19B|nr:hypothetical protein [Sphingopyxis solisilvae]
MASYWMNACFLAAALTLVAGSTAAQEPLKVKPGKVWKHQHSGISVPATLAGNARTSATSFAADDLDVGLQFDTPGSAEAMSVYFYRKTNGAVPVWFAQAQWAIENRDTFGNPAIVLAPEAFIPPGQKVASGLRAIYEPKHGNYRSTGVMLLPIGNWYVKIRTSSQTRSPAELARWMDAALAEIAWPRNIAPAEAASPAVPCAKPLQFQGKSADASGSDLTAEALGVALMSAAAGDDSIKKEPATTPIGQWCRDRQLEGNIAVYRPGGSETSYLLAYGDNGNGIWVGPSPMKVAMDEIASKNGTKASLRYNVTLHTATQDINFLLQDRLPSPERVIEILNANNRASTVGTWGKNRQVQINSGEKLK